MLPVVVPTIPSELTIMREDTYGNNECDLKVVANEMLGCGDVFFLINLKLIKHSASISIYKMTRSNMHGSFVGCVLSATYYYLITCHLTYDVWCVSL